MESYTVRVLHTNRSTDKPDDDPKIEGDPMKTLFVGRLSYEVKEEDLYREFARFGPIVKIRIVENAFASPEERKKKKHRGYAFVEFEAERDMKGMLSTNHASLSTPSQRGQR